MQIDAERCIWEDVERKDFQYLISISMPITNGYYYYSSRSNFWH